MPSLIQTALALEAFLNTPGIIALVFFPSQTLKYFLASPLPSIELNETAVLLARCVGILIMGLTPQLMLAYPSTKDAAEKRKIVYWTLGMGEAGLIPLLIWEAFRASDEHKAAGLWAGGFSRKAALMCAANLIPLVLWRVYVLAVKPQWLKGVEGTGKGRKKQ